MKLTAGEAVRSVPALNELNSHPLPIKLAVRLAQNQKRVVEVFEAYQRREQAIMDELGKPTGAPGQWNIPAANGEEFNRRITELQSEEADVEISQVTLSEIGDINIAPAHLIALDWMFADEPAEAEAA